MVVEVGPGVRSLRRGRSRHSAVHAGVSRVRVLPQSQDQSVPEDPHRPKAAGVMPDGTSRFGFNGPPGAALHGLQHVSPITRCSRKSRWPRFGEDAPFDKICYIGCGVTTGHRRGPVHREGGAGGERRGVRSRRHRSERRSRVRRLAGADMIVGVDLNPAREALGRKFGMTHFVNPAQVYRATWWAIWSS